ncbi:MAG: RNA methyltransferase [Pseudomonadota bacterium]
MNIANCQIVLVETSHPGNIGAAARAMKNMGLRQMALVNPCEHQVYECYARASGAEDIVDTASVHSQLADALADSTLVIGTSARLRSLAWPQHSPRESAAIIVEHCHQGKVSVVFGRERSGLTNDELALCSSLLNIPTAGEFSSLNVAAAVQVIAYEVLCAAQTGTQLPAAAEPPEPPASQQNLEQFYEHFFSVLEQVDYFDPQNPKHLPLRMRRFFNRAQPSRSELQVLRGFLSAVEKRAGKTE